MPDNPTNAVKACPNCGAELPSEHVLCVACGYHFGLGRRIDDGPNPAPATEAPARRSVGRAPGSTPVPKAIGAVLVVLAVALGAYLLSGKRQPANQSANTQQPGGPGTPSLPGVHGPPARPNLHKLGLAVARLEKASPEEIPEVVASVGDPERRPAIAGFIDACLRRRNVVPQDLVPILEACRRIAPNLVEERLARRLPAMLPRYPAGWGPGAARLLALLAKERRQQPGIILGRRMLDNGAPRSIWLEWGPLLASLYTDRQGRHPLGITFAEPKTLEQCSSSVVLLRFAGEPCLGVVIGRHDEVSVLTQPVDASRQKSVAEADWEAAAGDDWVTATCSFELQAATTDRLQHGTCFLLRFPATGKLADARPVRVGGTVPETIYDICRAEATPDAFEDPTIFAVSTDKTARRSGRHKGAGVGFAPTGEFVALYGLGRCFAADGVGKLDDLLQPRLVPRRTSTDNSETGSAATVTFAVFDGKGVLQAATATVRDAPDDSVCEQAEERFRQAPQEPAVTDGEEIPLEIGDGRASLRIPLHGNQAAPFVVQVRCSLADGSSHYDVPLVVSTAGSRPAGTGEWLVPEERRQQLAAAQSGTPVPLHHTVDGRRAHYGNVTVVSLSIRPSDLIADAAGEHIYVGDRAGIRRIELAGFQEKVGILEQAGSILLTGSSRGLVAVLQTGEEAEVRLLDPLTLAERGRFKPPFPPEHIAGSWRSPVLVLVNGDQTTLLDLAAGKVLEKLRTSTLLDAQQRRRTGSGPMGNLVDIAMTPQGDMLCVLGSQYLHRLRLSPTEGLAKPQDADIASLSSAPSGSLGMDYDGNVALAGDSVFSLRQKELAAVLDCPPHRPLALAQGNHWVLAATSIPKQTDFYTILDRRGAPIERWEAAGARPDMSSRGLSLPGGRRCLVWNHGGARLIEVGDAADAEEARQ